MRGKEERRARSENTEERGLGGRRKGRGRGGGRYWGRTEPEEERGGVGVKENAARVSHWA